jgi:putative flippase GtrA
MNIREIGKDFIEYLVPGILTTALEVAALIFLISQIHTRGVWYLFAVGVTFVIGTTIQYFAVHRFIFHDSDREFKEGYAYFMAIAVIGLILTLGLVILFTYVMHMPPIRARVVTALIVGVWNFFANYFISFEMHKKHTIEDRATNRK